MHAYSKERGGETCYDCDNCGRCNGEPYYIEKMLVESAERGVSIENLHFEPGYQCVDCERYSFEDDDELFYTMLEPDDIVWVCGECDEEYDEEEEAVSCCK